ncbi:DNA ligase [Perkinsela sp. CCAP 1560/4]|nr:DNA ligase [Perkinsela sp. CCAP 1560/4]|eukprot:KNH08230.1 DNA ligase [Perkinsela sp. CCAP 1560/4]
MKIPSLSKKALVQHKQRCRSIWDREISKFVSGFYCVHTRPFSCSCAKFFQFPFAQNDAKFGSTDTTIKSPNPQASLAPSPFQKMNILSGSNIGRPQFISKKPNENFAQGMLSNPPTEEFMTNEADFSAELLEEANSKHTKTYEKVVMMKIPPTKELFEKLKVQENPTDIADIQKQIQDMISDFSAPPASHPHSPKFGTADPAAPSYYKAEQSVITQSISNSFNSLNAKAKTSDFGTKENERVESAAFSPFAKPNYNPHSVSPSKPEKREGSLLVSPFQPPNTSIPEYYNEYLTDNQAPVAQKSNEKPPDPQFGAGIPGAPAGKSPENSTFSLFGANLQADSRQQVSFSTRASFIGTSQSSGTSIRNLAATSLASTYSGSVESVSERGERASGSSESVYVTNANIDFNPFTSGTVAKYKERIAEIDDSFLASKENGQGFLSQRSLNPMGNAHIDMKQLRLLGDASEQNKVKDLVITEDEWASQSVHCRQPAIYASERSVCCKCGKIFKDYHALEQHMTTTHPSTKLDLFESLQKNLGSMKQLHGNHSCALQHTDVSDWYDYGRGERDPFYTRPPPSRPCNLSPEKVAGYVARRQVSLAEVEQLRKSPAELPDEPTPKENVAASSQLVNEIVLNGSLEYAGERNINGSRYLQLYLQISPFHESADRERVSVRYFLRSTPSSVHYPTKKAKNKSALFEALGISLYQKRTENHFAVRDVSLEDASLLSTLEKALNGRPMVQCLVIGELKKDGVWDGANRTVLPYAYIRLNASKGRLIFDV